MHPSAPPYNDHRHNYAPPSPFPYFAASPNHSHGPNPNPLYSTTEYGYPNPYTHHLGPGSSLPPIYIGSCHVNINVGEPLVAERYDKGGNSSGGDGKSRSKLELDLDGCQQLGSGMSCDDHGGYGSRHGAFYANSKKVVLKLDINDDKAKKKVIETVSKLAGIESIAVDMKEKKLTVIGDVDLVTLVKKLRKLCYTEIVSVGPAKELEKKKDKPKKDEGKKVEEPKKDGGRRKEEEERKKIAELVRAYNPQIAQYYYVDNKEEKSEGCVIC